MRVRRCGCGCAESYRFHRAADSDCENGARMLSVEPIIVHEAALLLLQLRSALGIVTLRTRLGAPLAITVSGNPPSCHFLTSFTSRRISRIIRLVPHLTLQHPNQQIVSHRSQSMAKQPPTSATRHLINNRCETPVTTGDFLRQSHVYLSISQIKLRVTITIVSHGSINSHHDYHHQSIQQQDCESSLTIKRP